MDYPVEVTKTVEELIRSWDLAPEVERSLYEELRAELRRREPEELGRRSKAPIRFVTFPLTINLIGCPPMGLFFWIDDHTRPPTRIIIDAKRIGPSTPSGCQ